MKNHQLLLFLFLSKRDHDSKPIIDSQNLQQCPASDTVFTNWHWGSSVECPGACVWRVLETEPRWDSSIFRHFFVGMFAYLKVQLYTWNLKKIDFNAVSDSCERESWTAWVKFRYSQEVHPRKLIGVHSRGPFSDSMLVFLWGVTAFFGG